jgi:hypothetical protein
MMHCKISIGDWRETFRYVTSSAIFEESGCTYKTQPDSTFQGPFCASHCANNGSWKSGGGLTGSNQMLWLSVAFEPDYPDTPVLWVTTTNNKLLYYRRGSSGDWTQVEGDLWQISHAYRSGANHISGPFEVYGIEHDDDVFKLNDSGKWDKLCGGCLEQLSVGCNPKSANECQIWGVNDDSEIVYRTGTQTTDWIDISGSLVRVSVAYGKVENVMTSVIWGVDNNGAASYRKGVSGSWIHVSSSPALVQVAVAYDMEGINFLVYGVTAGGDVYHRNSFDGVWTRADNIGLKQVSVAFDPHGTPMVWGIKVDGGSSYRWHVDSSSSLEMASTAVQRKEIDLTAKKNSNYHLLSNVSLT